jgi:heat shock protein HtpX
MLSLGEEMYRAIQRNKRTTVILIACYIAIIGGLGVWASFALSSPWPGIIILGVAAAWVSVTLSRGVKIAQYLAHWRPVSRADERELYVIVENLAIRNGMPMPTVCVEDSPEINAFAVGMSQRTAIVGATLGTLNALDSTELEAVMAHEMSHIKNYDTRVNLVITALVGSMSFLAVLCWAFVLGALAGGSSSSSRRDRNDRSGAVAIAIAIVLTIPAMVFSILAWMVGPLFSAAVSRQREYLADASGVEMTRYPDGMISLLRKLQAQEKGVAIHSLALAAFYYHNERGGIRQMFNSTHPPLRKRIERVEVMANSL